MEIPYLYQLQEANFTDLSNTDFKIAVVDVDTSGLTAAQIDTLQTQGKIMFSYLSIGEAEDYRDYWIQGNWSINPPSFTLNENNEWNGNYRLKYWAEEWQQIILNKIEDIISKGYNGVYLDVLDAYQDANVINAYDGSTTTRQEIIDFTIRISEYAKSINPNFKIIPQNAVELLSVNEEVATAPNLAFINAIDGVGVEDTWTTGNPGGTENNTAPWTTDNLSYLKLATAAGKFILSTDYATEENLQTQFIANAIGEGFIPYIGTRRLDGTIDTTNYTSLVQMPDNWLDIVIDGNITTPELPSTEPEPPVIDDLSFTPPTGSGVIEGTDNPEEVQGNQSSNILSGLGGPDILYGEGGDDIIYDGLGDDTVWAGQGNDTLYAGKGNDLLAGEGGNDLFIIGPNNGQDLIDDLTLGDKIKLVNSPYQSALEAYQALSFDGNHSTLDLGDGNSIKILWVSPTEINSASFEVDGFIG